MFVASPWLVNKKFYDSLPAELQKVFDDNIAKAIDYNWSISEKQDDEAKKFLEEKGLVITVPSPEFRQAMKDSLKGFYEWYYETIPHSREIIKEMEALPR